MRIFDKDKLFEIFDVDLTRGYLREDKRLVSHHEPVPDIPEKSHYAIDKVFKNGGVSYKKVVDSPAIPGKPAFDEYEDIYVYVPYSEDELKNKRLDEIRERMNQLSQDFIQAWAGAQIYDLEERKAEFSNLHNELRAILGKEPRLYY